MIRVRALALVSILLAATVMLASPSAAAADADVAGGWAIEFTLPWGGTAGYPMWVVQDGSKLSGRVSMPGVGEYPLKGTIEGDRFRIVWQNNVDGEWMDIIFAGTVKGDAMSGTAKIGKYPEGELYARRTERP
jgi:hypothetical protein